jgi:hypothetical protein
MNSDDVARLIGRAYAQGWIDSRLRLVSEMMEPTADEVGKSFEGWISTGEAFDL